MPSNWISQRTKCFDSSGIRMIFDLGAKLTDPINLSIGQPDFEVPEEVRQAAVDAIQSGKNGYSLSQGVPVLLDKLQADVDGRYGHDDREVFVTCGTCGGLVLAMLALVDPGDEVIVFDPHFVVYDALVSMAGGRAVFVDTYPDFRVDAKRLKAAITPKTKAIIFNSPGNPTGVVASEDEVRQVAELALERDIALVSDEIYQQYCYDQPFVSPAVFNPHTLVVNSFSKSHAITGWRLGFAHGPADVIQQMIKLQQYSFVCAPQPAQWAGAVAMDVDTSGHIVDYRRKRDLLLQGLADCYEVVRPGGSFYAFPRAPWGTATEFVTRAIEDHQLLIIPGNVFSRQDTHFRVSYAVADDVIERGVEVLRKLATG